MTATFTADGESMRSATRKVQEALSDKYDTYIQDINGMMRVRVEGSSKTVEVQDTPSGAEITMELGSSEDNSMVRSAFDSTTFDMMDNDQDQLQPNRPQRNDEIRDERVKTTNQMGQVHKPFSKEEANYHGPHEDPASDEMCKNCAHYDNHGNCHIVPDIEPNGHCEEFYADVGFYAMGHKLPQEVTEVNLTIWGEMAERRLEGSAPAKVLTDIEEQFREKFDERDIQM
jgi:hypothetical protein